MKRIRRLSIKAARELARLIQEQEQAERFAGVWLPEEWAPFGYCGGEGGEAEQDDGAEEADADFREDGSIKVTPDAPLPFFSHFSSQHEGTTQHTRHFGSVRDFCLQPFANPENEALWRREEYVDGHFREWKVNSGLRSGHGVLKTEEDVVKKNLFWFGAKSGDESAARAFKGWPEGAEKVRRMMEDVSAPAPLNLRRKVARGDQGDELDIHQVYCGDLDRAWTRRRRQSSRSRMSVRLVALIGGSQHMEHERMFWRGAAVAKLAEVLEEAGYRVEIVGAQQSRLDCLSIFDDPACEEYQSFIVKDAAAPMDLEAIAGVLCNAGFFRTWGFRGSYAIVERKVRDTVRRPETKFERIGKTLKQVNTGRTIVETMMARSTVIGKNPALTMSLDADGTKTFSVPVSISDKDDAVKWVNQCLANLEGGEEAEYEDE